jgi:hypothetical protein
MPTVPDRSRKALVELARVCNRLASELTADLKQAANEIENLKKEIRKIRHDSIGKVSKTASASRTTNRKRVKNTSSSKGQRKNSGKASYLPEAARETGPAHESGSFVFPKEPFNPPTPPAEPSTNPENN